MLARYSLPRNVPFNVASANSTSRSLQWAVWGLLLAVVLGISIAYVISESRRQHFPVLAEVRDFKLTNQLGNEITLASLKGKVWVADIIFTRCPGPCATMTRQMAELQKEIRAKLPVQFVSLTTDPEYDQPAILAQYGQTYGTDPARWWFLTGTKSQIADLALDSLKLSAFEKKPEMRQSDADLFIHSTYFVLVDKRARLRGVFESVGEGVEWPAIKKRIVSAVNQLARER